MCTQSHSSQVVRSGPRSHGWTSTQPIAVGGLGVDSGPQPQPKKGDERDGQTLAGTQPSSLLWYKNGWTGLQPNLEFSGGLEVSPSLLLLLREKVCFDFFFHFFVVLYPLPPLQGSVDITCR
jgi:hypothetical protein